MAVPSATTTSSYVSGSSDRGMLGVTIGDLLDEVVARYPNNDALVVPHQNVRWTYAEFGRWVDQVACGLVAIGVEKNDRVGIWSPNRSEWALVQFASAKIGAILVNINPAYRAAELEYALNQSGCRFLVMADQAKNSDFHAILKSIAPELAACEPRELHAKRISQLQTVVTLGKPQGGMLSWPQMLELGRTVNVSEVQSRQRELSFDDPINIQYTSGTTGFPKGATLSHHNIVNNGFFVADIMRFTDQDRLVIPVPLYHCFGMVLGNLGCVTHGATMIYPSETFDPESVLRVIAAERATALYGVPTMFIAELGVPNFSDFDLTSLRTGIMAGALCPIEIMRRVKTEMHIEQIEIAYGMTETSPVSMQTRYGTPLEKQVSTVGQVHPHVEAKIVDIETGKLLPRGETGEFCSRGYLVMLGYWQDAEATQAAIDEAGWMHSGDLAVMDEAGYVEIVGRIKDMIIRGGENIYPREIETFLMAHPKVKDVYVVGIPDEKYGEEVVAWVQLQAGQSLTEDEVKSFCQDRIAYYKIPKHVKFVEEFPLTVTGKVQKFKMREQSIRELLPHNESP